MFPHAIKLDRPCLAEKNLLRRRTWVFLDDESKTCKNFKNNQNRTTNIIPIPLTRSPCVVTYPSAGGQRVTRGCVFQERNTRGVATNVYLGKTSEKPEKTWSTNFKWKGSGVVFTHGEGISTPHVRHKRRQPLIKYANRTLIFTFPFMFLYLLYPFIFFLFSWSTRVFPFAPTYSSIVMRKSDLRSSFGTKCLD